MRIRSAVCVLAVGGIFLLSSVGASWAANPAKIGYFDLQAVLEQSKYGKDAKQELQREKDRIKGDVDSKANAFKTAKEEFDKKRSVMDEKTREKKTKELQELQAQGEKVIMESNAKMQKLWNDSMGPIMEKALEVVRKIAKDDKYDLIFESNKSGLVYGADSLDLTKRIVQEVDRSSLPRKTTP